MAASSLALRTREHLTPVLGLGKIDTDIAARILRAWNWRW
jgi:hypothetical protein